MQRWQQQATRLEPPTLDPACSLDHSHRVYPSKFPGTPDVHCTHRMLPFEKLLRRASHRRDKRHSGDPVCIGLQPSSRQERSGKQCWSPPIIQELIQ
ncbi:hypothetical protein LEMLEM_LOCUS22408 [Lemmus lemmus]